MNIGLDLGFGYVKGVNSQNKRILFPSIVSIGFDRPLAGIFNTNDIIENLHIRIVDKTGENSYYVGNLARREGFSDSFTLDIDKYTQPEAKALLSTAVMLLTLDSEPEEPINLVTGLPLKQFQAHKKAFEEELENYKALISLPEHKLMKTIEFEKVTVFPQAAGAAYYALLEDLDRYLYTDSYIVLIDIGFKTTDYIVFLIEDRPHFLPDLSGTIDTGISKIFTAIEQIYLAKTGATIDTAGLMTIFKKESIYFKGKYVDFTEELTALKKELARLIEKRIYATLKEVFDRVSTVFIAGGGGSDLYPYLKNIHADVVLVKDAQFANALGFLKIAEINK
ncbi:ParM/StbA family protein [Caldanaerobacter subterraneus]|uniref:Plasmid segregation protein ParM n=1 Tax=Caldanaerobacter subterraneus TaxID=911092 RepID=A0A4V2S9M2_9THEO|nr:ParM/StbA family protein [Caldanaerobacter subterraneus]TCO68240.1 plasmid segregation protein ParM [Caldanaerobacter subterraneus]